MREIKNRGVSVRSRLLKLSQANGQTFDLVLIPGARLPQEHGALWGWLEDQDAPTLLDLLALCSGTSTTAMPA